MAFKWNNVSSPNFGSVSALTSQIAKAQQGLFDPVGDLIKDGTDRQNRNYESESEGNTASLISAIRNGKERPDIKGGWNPKVVEEARYQDAKYRKEQEYKQATASRAASAESRAAAIHKIKMANGGRLPGVDKDGNIVGGGYGSALDAAIYRTNTPGIPATGVVPEQAQPIDNFTGPSTLDTMLGQQFADDSFLKPENQAVDGAQQIFNAGSQEVATEVAAKEAQVVKKQEAYDALTPDSKFDFNVNEMFNGELAAQRGGAKGRNLDAVIDDYAKESGMSIDETSRKLIKESIMTKYDAYKNAGTKTPASTTPPAKVEPAKPLNRLGKVNQAKKDEVKAQTGLTKSNSSLRTLRKDYDKQLDVIKAKHDNARKNLADLSAKGLPSKTYNAKMKTVAAREKTERANAKTRFDNAKSGLTENISRDKALLKEAQDTQKFTEREKDGIKASDTKKKDEKKYNDELVTLKKDYPKMPASDRKAVARGKLALSVALTRMNPKSGSKGKNTYSKLSSTTLEKELNAKHNSNVKMNSDTRGKLDTALSAANTEFAGLTLTDIHAFLSSEKGQDLTDPTNTSFDLFGPNASEKIDKKENPWWTQNFQVTSTTEDFKNALLNFLEKSGKTRNTNTYNKVKENEKKDTLSTMVEGT